MKNIKSKSLMGLGLVLVAGVVACQKAPPSQAGVKPADKKDDGSISGGGGYVDSNSLEFLKSVSQELAYESRNASPSIFEGITPAGWDQDKIAGVVEHVDPRPNEHRYRDGRELMFDYDTAQGMIVALAPYFYSYAFASANDPDAQFALRRGLKIRLLHEVAHLWGDREEDAEVYARKISAGTDGDILECALFYSPGRTGAYVYIHRPTARFYMGSNSACVDPSVGYRNKDCQEAFSVYGASAAIVGRGAHGSLPISYQLPKLTDSRRYPGAESLYDVSITLDKVVANGGTMSGIAVEGTVQGNLQGVSSVAGTQSGAVRCDFIATKAY